MPDPRGLLCFGGFARHDWSLLWQRQQSIMTRLAGRFSVYYIERFGTRRLAGCELLAAAWKRLVAPRGRLLAPAAQGIHFITPKIAPLHSSGFWRRRNLNALRRAVEAAWPEGLKRSVLWVYNPSYLALEFLRETRGQWERTVYDCNQRFAFNRYYPSEIGEIDAAIAREVDLVLTDSATIAEEKRRENANTHHVPQGVDPERFLWTGVNRTPTDEMRWLKPPVFGYHGAWHQAFDESLIAALLEKAGPCSFLFIGPTLGHEEALRRRFDDAVFLGPRDHIRLGRYVNGFDVCLIPYRRDEHSEGVFPTKFFEYVATGLPIVATDLPDLRPYGEWVTLADGAERFVEAARAAVGRERRPIEEVRPFVEQHSWDRRVETILGLLDLP
jgi:glycosyltransferase involved in cell wall biosynthesis